MLDVIHFWWSMSYLTTACEWIALVGVCFGFETLLGQITTMVGILLC